MRFSAKHMKCLIAIVFVLCMAYVWWLSPLTLALRLVTTVSGALITATAIMAAR